MSNTSSSPSDPLLLALTQSSQLQAIAKYCETIARFENDHNSAELFASIRQEAEQHTQGHLDFLLNQTTKMPSATTSKNKLMLVEKLTSDAKICREVWQPSLNMDRSDVADWLENTAKSLEHFAKRLQPER